MNEDQDPITTEEFEDVTCGGVLCILIIVIIAGLWIGYSVIPAIMTAFFGR